VALARVERQRAVDGLPERLRDRRVELVEERRRLLLLLERELGQRRGLVGEAAREQLVGDDAERVEVRRRPGVLAARLLRREVGGRARSRPG